MAEDGIDQGEVLSPLMWRVFYDPLLCKVQEEEGLGYIAEVRIPVDSRRGTWSVERVRQAAIAYADDTTWLGKSKEEMESILAIANEFFVINDIQLNENKCKLLVINKKKDVGEDIQINKIVIKAAKKSAVVRMLGIWLNGRLKESLVKDKAKEIIRQTALTLRWKKMTISQLVYVNNIYLIPKLCYILQVSNLSKIALQKIQQPYFQLIKNKIGMARTAGNYIISHRGMMGCKLLEQELCIKQISSLQNRLNNDGTVLKLAHIRIKQGLLNVGLVAME